MSCAHHLFHITTRSPLGPVFASAFTCAQHADVLRMCKGCIAIDCRREDMRAVLALYDILTHQLRILREGETGWRISICQSNYYGVRSGYRTGSQVHTHTHTWRACRIEIALEFSFPRSESHFMSWTIFLYRYSGRSSSMRALLVDLRL